MKVRVVALFVVVGLVGASSARAQCRSGCKEGFFASVARDYAERKHWPEPYVQPEVDAARAPFGIMVNNGWRRQNLLAADHFKDDGTELSEAGKLKVYRIVTDVPLPHRTIYVHRNGGAEKTLARIKEVQKVAAEMSPDGVAPPVLETTVSPGGWPADRVDAVSRKFQTAIPAPQLPNRESGSSESKQ